MTQKQETIRQHYLPRFLQKNFAIPSNKDKVCIYEKSINKHIPPIRDVYIKSNMQSDYYYGTSQIAERHLSNLEDKAAFEISKMVKNPKKYKRKNPKLSPIMLDFVMQMFSRSPHTINSHDEIVKNILEQCHNSPSEYYQELALLIEPHIIKEKSNNEINGVIATHTIRNQTIQKFNLNNYMLIPIKNNLFIGDSHKIGYLPLSGNLLLAYGPAVERIERYLTTHSKEQLRQSINAETVKQSISIIILGPTSTLNDIDIDSLNTNPHILSGISKKTPINIQYNLLTRMDVNIDQSLDAEDILGVGLRITFNRRIYPQINGIIE